MLLLVEKHDDLESGSPCLDAPVTSTRRQQREQTMAWVAVIFYDFLCFPKASCVVDALHGWEMAANDVLRCLHHPLEGLVISSGEAAEPDSNAAREDALNVAHVKVSEGSCGHAKLLDSPQKVKALHVPAKNKWINPTFCVHMIYAQISSYATLISEGPGQKRMLPAKKVGSHQLINTCAHTHSPNFLTN